MKDTVQGLIGVIDSEGTVVASSDLPLSEKNGRTPPLR
jgi:hypothetical protein